jgi:hypothetical protein
MNPFSVLQDIVRLFSSLVLLVTLPLVLQVSSIYPGTALCFPTLLVTVKQQFRFIFIYFILIFYYYFLSGCAKAVYSSTNIENYFKIIQLFWTIYVNCFTTSLFLRVYFSGRFNIFRHHWAHV